MAPKYDKARFMSALDEMRTLTTQSPEQFGPRLRALFAEAGVAFVLVPAISKAHVGGVARWLNPHKPLIQLSLYGKTNDKFWFTLFHEAAHILLHEKKLVFLDDASHAGNDTPQEQEANQWAGEFLIPCKYEKELPELTTQEQVKTFARKIELHPGIVVGRLQHERIISYTQFNHLKVSFRFNEK
jgi:HTH-type transcriptional regulator/antitoxin HigA